MFVRFKPWKVVASFAFVGLLIAVPVFTSYLFAGVGLLTFVVCPASMILLHNPQAELGWRFFAYAGPLNAALYAAYGRLLVYLGTKI
jgi:hypothetical protein